MFSKETYTERRNKLRKMIGNGIILLQGNNDAPMNYPANTYRYRQDSTFLYFFGLNHAGLAGIIDIDNNKEIIFEKRPCLDKENSPVDGLYNAWIIINNPKQPIKLHHSFSIFIPYITNPKKRIYAKIKNPNIPPPTLKVSESQTLTPFGFEHVFTI